MNATANTPATELAAEIKAVLKKKFEFEMSGHYRDIDFSTVKIDWSRVDCSYAKFFNCNFSGVKFNPKSMYLSSFDGCNFSKAKLQSCTFSYFNGYGGIDACNFTEADLRGTHFCCPIANCDLSDAKIKGLNLNGASLRDVKF